MKTNTAHRPAGLLVSVFSGLALSACADDANEQWAAQPVSDVALITQLDGAIASGEFRDINSIVVMVDGELRLERYYNGADRDSIHNPRSVGKTFAATVLGIAIDEGYIDSIEQPLSDFYNLAFFDNQSSKKAAVTLRDLLTMTSGFDAFDFDPDSIGNEENMYPTDDWVAWALNLPMAANRNPGEEWRYFTGGAVLIGDILNQAVPGGLESYADRKLFGPLGIRNYQWQHTPQRVANTAGGIQLTPLDFAKYGELHRLRGVWQGESVVPRAWVDAMLEPAVETTIEGENYGYLWWHKQYQVGDRSFATSYCSGNGGNKIFVFDDPGMVIVVTASAYGQPYMHSQIDRIMREYLLPAYASASD